MNFIKYANDNKENLLKDLTDLIKYPSVLHDQPDVKEAPFGYPLVECLDHFLKMGEEAGFKAKNIDNVVGYLEYDSGLDEAAPMLAILGHLDVVPTGDSGWMYDPFTATLVGNRLYARGSIDDKGPVMAAFYALKCLKENNVKLNKIVRIIVGTDEESGSRCLARYMQTERIPDVAFSPDADYPVIYGEKGIASFDFHAVKRDSTILRIDSGDVYNVVPEKAMIEATKDLTDEFNKYLEKNQFKGEVSKKDKIYTYTLFGKRAHAMEPRNGVNALVNLCHFAKDYFDDDMLKFVSKYLNDSRMAQANLNFRDEEMGDLTVNVANFKMNGNDEKVGINIRYPIHFDYDHFYNGLKKIASEFNVNCVALGNSKPHYVDKNSELVKTLFETYQKYMEDYTHGPITIGGGTYARAFENAVAFGIMMPGAEDVMHQVNEYVDVDVLIKSVAIFADAIYKLAK